MLFPTCQGYGLATEALQAFLPVFFRCLATEDMCRAYVHGDNAKSMRVLEKCGFSMKENEQQPKARTGQELRDDADQELRLAVLSMFRQEGAKPAPSPGRQMVCYTIERGMVELCK
jgi:RimJ/RimL family protein N-acetyltransferase